MMCKNILILFIKCVFLLGMDIKGDPKLWEKSDFIGFDEVGDNYAIGDISSVFARIENDKLFFRLTFSDMFSRIQKLDTFKNNHVKLVLNIKNNESSYFNRMIDISEIIHKESSYDLLRTPTNNLLELIISWPFNYPKQNLLFTVEIFNGNELVDVFSNNERKQSNGGNVAFVHHGNQGLTYTQVFYGQDPLETSGFDEILEVHQASGIPGNFHMSGTLMPAAEWHDPDFNDWISSGVENGYVAMLTSALGQHMMPFVQNAMNDWAVSIETDMVEYRYNYIPKVAWVPERVWLTPGSYPDAGVIDWLGDNWEQHGVEAVILDDYIHCPGSDNKKIHWMENNSGINLRVIPIDNEFVGKMHYDADGAKNHIASTGQYGITVYGTDWEVAAEMNEHHETSFLDNYESVLWYCYDNYPAINVWKLDAAIYNSDFNGTEINVGNGTYGLLGGTEGYGGSNNSWYTNWANTPSLSDFHDPKWNYGYIWNDAYNNLMSAPNNSLAQLGWYTLMINLHETGWHTEGEIAGWEHHYSSHMKNANVHAEAARWAHGDYSENTAAYFLDIDHDGGDELVMHNDQVFAVIEGVGGRVAWLFYSDGNGSGYSVIGSDVSYFSETDGDYNESSYNHVAALSDVSPNQQNEIYEIEINNSSGSVIMATLSLGSVIKTISLTEGNNFFDIQYHFESTGYIKSGWSPDLLDLIWSGKSHLQRMYGDYGSYTGYRNLASGATVGLVLGSGGAGHNYEFEGTLVKGDEIYGAGIFNIYLFAGYTSEPYDEYMNKVVELDDLASGLNDEWGPLLNSAIQVAPNVIHLFFSDDLNFESVENIINYNLIGFSDDIEVHSANLIYGRKVILTLTDSGFGETVEVTGLLDNNGNMVDPTFNTVNIEPLAINPHLVGTFNDWDPANHEYDLVLNENNIWSLKVVLSSGIHEYKVIESNAFDENDWPGTNQVIVLEESKEITFLANCGFNTGVRNWDEYVTHLNPLIVGNFFESISMGSNWDTLNTAGSMYDDNGDGIFNLEILIPEGNWEYKVVLNQNWDQDTFGSGGNFSLISDGISPTVFNYDFSQNSTFYNTENINDCVNLGDLNADGGFNVLDIVTLANCILSGTCENIDNSCAADMNGDGGFNVLDIVTLANCILSGTCE